MGATGPPLDRLGGGRGGGQKHAGPPSAGGRSPRPAIRKYIGFMGAKVQAETPREPRPGMIPRRIAGGGGVPSRPMRAKAVDARSPAWDGLTSRKKAE